MNTIQAFDCQMKLIEMNAKGREIDGITVYPTADEIYEEIKLGSAIAEREQAGVFKFFTQMTPKEYIKHRKLMAAYQKLAIDKISMSDACEIAGFDSEQALVKKFKQTLGVTPGEVRKEGNMSKYTHEVTFERMFGTKPSPEKASWNVGLDEFGRIVLNSSNKVSEDTAWIIKAGNNELRLEKQAGGDEDDTGWNIHISENNEISISKVSYELPPMEEYESMFKEFREWADAYEPDYDDPIAELMNSRLNEEYRDDFAVPCDYEAAGDYYMEYNPDDMESDEYMSLGRSIDVHDNYEDYMVDDYLFDGYDEDAICGPPSDCGEKELPF